MQHLDALGDDPDIDTLVAYDLEFHHMIAVGSGNPVLCSLIDGLSGRTQRARVWRGLTQEDAVTQTIREHRAIATAIRDRQPAIARAWATAHIAGVETWLRHSLADPDLPAGLTAGVPRDGPDDPRLTPPYPACTRPIESVRSWVQRNGAEFP